MPFDENDVSTKERLAIIETKLKNIETTTNEIKDTLKNTTDVSQFKDVRDTLTSQFNDIKAQITNITIDTEKHVQALDIRLELLQTEFNNEIKNTKNELSKYQKFIYVLIPLLVSVTSAAVIEAFRFFIK